MKKLYLIFIVIFLIFVSGCSSAKQGMNTIDANDKQMRVYVKGSGQQTVLLLSGFATVNPIDDFMPLIDELSKDFTVVALEYPGYGESDITYAKRTNKAIVEEIRSTLNKLNIKPPYVLMPHSMSGLYSLYYANTYPSEVKAIVGIDASLPQKQLERWTKESFEHEKLSENYNGLNISITNQWNEFYDNSKELKDTKYPKDLPVLSFLSSEQVNSVDKMIKTNEMQTSWIDINKNVITNQNIQTIEVLNSGHYMHHDQLQKISQMSKNFILQYT